MIARRFSLMVLWCFFGLAWRVSAADPSSLRLVPFPKKIETRSGTFTLREQMWLQVSRDSAAVLSGLLRQELDRAGYPGLRVSPMEDLGNVFRLSLQSGAIQPIQGDEGVSESYCLEVGPDAIECEAPDRSGVTYGMQTLCQLIRANRRGESLPCLRIRDWPSLHWRCFQDDLTRGPSSTSITLQQHIELGAALKMNLFTYYMEYQYAFKKHPIIGPENGSLTPVDLSALVEFAKWHQVEILGNQQSFGHFARILQHPQYAALRETSSLLTPVNEDSYRLLDDLYSEVCPRLPFRMFNVCCDETWGLGEGPSKELAKEIGVGGVYVQHIRRVHDLLKSKYQKRMMMWGDIILQHPDKLDQIPKDTVMLTWGYGPSEDFEDQILPFAQSGYEYFVCPGISNWSRILPDFGVATTNIQNFVRDGAKHGAIGMLNTAWEDDGEALQGYKWHGYAWGAECAWNGSSTSAEDFNRRIGAVLFGEPGDHFGQAIDLLAQTHRLPGMRGMNNARFWDNDFLPKQGVPAAQACAARLLAVVRPAISHLETCQREATVNKPLLEAFLLGAKRMELIGQRMLDGLKAAEAYTYACSAESQAQRLKLLGDVDRLVANTRKCHAELGKEFQRLWVRESKPYALDWTMARYSKIDDWYRDLEGRLKKARVLAEEAKSLPSPETIGLATPTAFSRRTRPRDVLPEPLLADSDWLDPLATHRFGLRIDTGPVERFDLPIELELSLSVELATKPIRAFCLTAGHPREILAQLDPTDKPGAMRCSMIIHGALPKETQVAVQLYLGLPHPPDAREDSVTTTRMALGMWCIENDTTRWLLGPEGAHIYQWEVKKTNHPDLTMPGSTGWAGFADLGRAHRGAANKIDCLAKGPAIVRFRCEDTVGMVKTIRFFAGTPVVEVVLSEPVEYYFDFDDPKYFAADGPTPGTYLFSNGVSGSVGKGADGVPAQVKVDSVHWAIKSNSSRLALGMTTPEVAADFVVGPGAGAGGVGIENSHPTNHFITFASQIERAPHETMQRLQQTLNFKSQPEVTLYGLQRNSTHQSHNAVSLTTSG